MSLTYQEKQQLEQLRFASTQLSSSLELDQLGEHAVNFDAWLSQWLRSYKLRYPNTAEQLAPLVGVKRFTVLISIIFCIFGIFSIGGLIPAERQQINLFWLLSVLLGGHTLAWILWIGLTVFYRYPQSGALGHANEAMMKLLSRFTGSASEKKALSIAYWQTILSPHLRAWQFGVFTHVAWLGFLFGSCFGLAFIFATQQFDFVWESTLLHPEQLKTGLNIISTPITYLGWQVPELNASDEVIRRFWALVAMTSVCVYAILPRILVWGFTRSMLQRRQKQWELDYSYSFYITLKKQFLANLNKPQIIDADEYPSHPTQLEFAFSQRELPTSAQWFGLEVNPTRQWEKDLPNVIGIINDQKTFNLWSDDVKAAKTEFVVFVEGLRSADRGLERKLTQLKGDHIGLVIAAEKGLSEAKIQAWLELVNRVQWPIERAWLKRLPS